MLAREPRPLNRVPAGIHPRGGSGRQCSSRLP